MTYSTNNKFNVPKEFVTRMTIVKVDDDGLQVYLLHVISFTVCLLEGSICKALCFSFIRVFDKYET